MRLAIVATPALFADQRPAPGALDGDLVRARLPLPDTAFDVLDVDPAVDVAEQLETLFDRGAIERDAAVVFYASCSVLVSVEGELYLCLDPQEPATGDALRDIAAVFRDRAQGPTLFVLECRHAPAEHDPFRSVAIVGAAKEAVDSRATGVELLVAARPLAAAQEDAPSPFTRAIVSALDDADPAAGLTMETLYERIHESEALLGVVPCFGHARGRASFELIPRTKRRTAMRDVDRSSPQAEDEAVVATFRQGDADSGSAGGTPAPPAPAAPTPAASPPAASPPAAVSEVVDPPPPVQPAAAAAGRSAAGESEPPSRRESFPPMELPVRRSLQNREQDLPKVIVSDRAPPPSPSEPPPADGKASDAEGGDTAPSKARPAPSVPPLARSAEEHIAAGDVLAAGNDADGALDEFRKALGLLGTSASDDRAKLYVRIGNVKRHQERPREAISNFEKALQLAPDDRGALEALVALNVQERDWRAVLGAEERYLGTLGDDERFERLVEFGVRWRDVAEDNTRAQNSFERARELRPDDLDLLEKLRRLYEATNYVDEAIATRRRIAELTSEPRQRAELYFELGQYCVFDLKREELGLELLDLALESDPTMLEPLAVVARILAERQEWGELERAYRGMLERVERIPESIVRKEVAWELCRRLGLLFRDHLEDPELALDAFEDALELKPSDLAGRRVAVELARAANQPARAIRHLQVLAAEDPLSPEPYHELFEVFQRTRRPDQAYLAASVAMHLRQAETRERFVFEEHRPEGVPKLAKPLRSSGWALLAAADRDGRVETLVEAVMPAAISAKLAQLASEGRLPQLDSAARQDAAKSTVSITRSFAWASHFLGVPAPHVYLVDDPNVGLAAVIAEEPAVIAGGRVLRGRSPTDLAFLAGRHLAYYVGGHRLLLYYPSLDELVACLFAALSIVRPGITIPPRVSEAVTDLERRLAAKIEDSHREQLVAAAKAFTDRPADVVGWAQAVERCATRAGYVLSGDLDVAASCIKSDPGGLLDADAKLADLYNFAISDAHHALRELLGTAIEP